MSLTLAILSIVVASAFTFGAGMVAMYWTIIANLKTKDGLHRILGAAGFTLLPADDFMERVKRVSQN